MRKSTIAGCAFLLTAACMMFHSAWGAGSKTYAQHIHWSYEGDESPKYWGTLDQSFEACSNGTSQSPIDLKNAVSRADVAAVDFHYKPSALTVWNNSHTVQFNYDPGSYITLSGVRYKLLQFHIHSPSEHKIGGKTFAGEIHLVHQSEAGKIAVVSILLSADSQTDNPAYKPIFDHLPATATTAAKSIPDVSIDASKMLPTDRASFQYIGSLTTPPCTEGIQWNVFIERVPLSSSQITSFKTIFKHGNARPVQDLNQRPIYRIVKSGSSR